MTALGALSPTRTAAPAAPGFGAAVRAEWIKTWTVRSTGWSLTAMFVLGAGLTALVCALAAEDLAAGTTGEPVGAFLTWGMMFAQVTAIVLGTLAVTSEYGTGMIRATLAANPRRGTVLAAKAVVLTGTLFVAGTVTALAGYLAGNWFLDREGIGVALSDDGVLRSLYGSGLYMAGLGLFAAAVGLLVRHTAAALSIVLGLVFVVGNMVMLLPDAWGEWATKLMPGNAGGRIATPESFNPMLLDPWVGFAVFAAEIAVLLAIAAASFSRRDA
ncbi:ABC transporter permease subunit [Geodermatophilus sabuli]|uniref:ABC-2 type transport system permease protein n=1 Tax=Geodermatophilus sabuli TaxID=1564158 RepID=A0A285E6A1_9ACTN|nr:ABC transporter permease subunit [Geodermatophilus sabuli]MBB3082741.1 ABC-2 type transport system permease protein [Geodermatophilus sabuli]SNX94393.1 ABC-2 type transport system permease protein [Geodermatophilus sabuli]